MGFVPQDATRFQIDLQEASLPYPPHIQLMASDRSLPVL
jgi:hypothetical protein